MIDDAVKPRPVKLTPRQQRLVARRRFNHAVKIEKQFSNELKSVAHQVGVIVRKLAPTGKVKNPKPITEALNRYAEILEPWAKVVSERLIAEVGRRDAQAWQQMSEEIGSNLRKEITKAPTGKAMQQILAGQVDLITSLPKQAAQRVQRLTIQGLVGGTRADEIAKEILRTGKVTESRAMLIARTETSRTSTAMIEARSRFIGSDSYTWRAVMDPDTRSLHRKLNGTVHKWDEPPIVDESGIRAHPGSIWNCRCYAEPILPDIV